MDRNAGHTELQDDYAYAGVWGDHPVQEVLLLPFILLQHTADHLYGIAGVLRAPETRMTHQTLHSRCSRIVCDCTPRAGAKSGP
ncbi:MAG: hypothetical protein M3Q87_03335 [Actinomycetota bacterium]|nr:hypothetical protein [Actinomycetota bacterium]